jgi:hypothetical protein
LVAGPRGGIEIIGDKPLDLNFGQEQRALRFLRTRLKQGKSSATVKSFEVPKPFAEDVAARAVPESLAKKYPDAPLRVDISKAPDQFRLRSKKDLDALRSYLNP